MPTRRLANVEGCDLRMKGSDLVALVERDNSDRGDLMLMREECEVDEGKRELWESRLLVSKYFVRSKRPPLDQRRSTRR